MSNPKPLYKTNRRGDIPIWASREVRILASKASPEAIERLLYWMRSDNPKASVAACVALLDRAVGKPAQQLPVTEDGQTVTHITARITLVAPEPQAAVLEHVAEQQPVLVDESKT